MLAAGLVTTISSYAYPPYFQHLPVQLHALLGRSGLTKKGVIDSSRSLALFGNRCRTMMSSRILSSLLSIRGL